MAQELVLVPKTKYEHLLQKIEEENTVKTSSPDNNCNKEESVSKPLDKTQTGGMSANLSSMQIDKEPRKLYVKRAYSSIGKINQSLKKHKESKLKRDWIVYNI